MAPHETFDLRQDELTSTWEAHRVLRTAHRSFTVLAEPSPHLRHAPTPMDDRHAHLTTVTA